MELVTSFIIYFIGFVIIMLTLLFYSETYQNFFNWIKYKWAKGNLSDKLWIVFVILNGTVCLYIIYKIFLVTMTGT